MKIIFMGTPEFALPSLQSIMTKHDVLAVVTAPDKQAGRGHHFQSSPIKLFAVQHAIPVLQPKNLKSQKFIDNLNKLKADLFIVVAFRMLPEIVWSLPKYGTLNLHASLLPNYRGAAPIQHAIMNGEHTTGLTVFKLNSQIDTGDIISNVRVSIGADESGGELHDRLMNLGGQLLLESIDNIENENIKFISQDDSKASFAPKLFRAECEVHWNRDVKVVYNHIRALSPYPCAWFTHLSQSYKIYKCKMIEENPIESPGSIIVHGAKLKIACLNGYIDILEIQPNGKRKMNSMEFLNGFKSKL